MNERIQELAEQAGLDHDSYDRYGLFDEGKFAQLIVQECVALIDAQMTTHRFDEDIHLGLGDVRFTIGMQEDLEEKILNHFGVV